MAMVRLLQLCSMCALSDGFINNHRLQQTLFSLLFSVVLLQLNCLYNGRKCENAFCCRYYGVKYVCHSQTDVGLLDFTPRQGLRMIFFLPILRHHLVHLRVPTIEKQFICSSIAKNSSLFSPAPDVNCVGILH